MGEASNPGPPKYRARRRVVDSDNDVLTSLEHELTLIDPFVTKWIQWIVAPSVRCVGCVRTGPLRSPAARARPPSWPAKVLGPPRLSLQGVMLRFLREKKFCNVRTWAGMWQPGFAGLPNS